MTDLKKVRVTGTIRTNKIGSECKFDFTEEVPLDLVGEELEEYMEDAAQDVAFRYMEWNFQVEEIEE